MTPTTPPARPAPDVPSSHGAAVRRRGRPPWWAVVLVQIAGACGAAALLLFAAISLPRHGFFGVENDLATRRSGALAALATGPALLAGPLLVGVVRRDGRWLAWSGALAGGVGLVLLLALSGS